MFKVQRACNTRLLAPPICPTLRYLQGLQLPRMSLYEFPYALSKKEISSDLPISVDSEVYYLCANER